MVAIIAKMVQVACKKKKNGSPIL
uniref:Uncharacterized protein n=1 Tax=Arundo donax TaxID=35708 RepID=A0A0A9F7F8_ARUDO